VKGRRFNERQIVGAMRESEAGAILRLFANNVKERSPWFCACLRHLWGCRSSSMDTRGFDSIVQALMIRPCWAAPTSHERSCRF